MNTFFTAHPEVLNRLHDSVISTDLDGIVIDCNRAAENIFEYSREELIGRSVAILYPPEQLSKMAQLVEQVRKTGKCDGEFENLTKTGRRIWIHLSVSLLEDDQKKPYAMLGFSIDITAQKLAEQAQRESEVKNRAARAAAGVGTWYWDLKTGELAWDEESCRLLGAAAEAKPSFALFMSYVHPEDRERLTQSLQQSIEKNTEYHAEYRVIRSDGTVRWLSGRGRTYVDGSNAPDRMLGVASDITRRKETEAELQRTEAKYRVLFDSPFIGVASGTLDRFTGANETYCRQIGYSLQEMLSGRVRWQDITPNEFLEKDYVAMQQMLQTGVCNPFEKEYIRKDGSRIRVLLGAALLTRDPIEWGCFTLDITQQHRAFAALRASELVASAAKMSSALAHEINNPLAALSNAIYLLRFGQIEAQREQLLIAAQDSVDRVSRITRQIIGLYTEAEQVSEFKLDEVLEDTIAAHHSRARAKNIKVLKRNQLPTQTFRGVEPDFRRMLSSLVENAIDHTLPGGQFKIHLYRGRDWKRNRDGLKVVVCDNGPGIPPEKIPSLFEPFYTTKSQRGSGLGLWTTRGIIEKHGGRVQVRSSTRKGVSGTCVSVFLPERLASRGLTSAAG